MRRARAIRQLIWLTEQVDMIDACLPACLRRCLSAAAAATFGTATTSVEANYETQFRGNLDTKT